MTYRAEDVYNGRRWRSGKGMAGLIDLVRHGHFKTSENVVFLHTGGSVGLFGYNGIFDATRPN